MLHRRKLSTNALNILDALLHGFFSVCLSTVSILFIMSIDGDIFKDSATVTEGNFLYLSSYFDQQCSHLKIRERCSLRLIK